MAEPIGWLSSVILLTTIAAQIVKQWRDRSARGVSRWLFVGQAAASLGFLVYSVLLRNWVFTLTNGTLLLSALIGAGITWHFKQQSSAATSQVAKRSAADAVVLTGGAGRHPDAHRVRLRL